MKRFLGIAVLSLAIAGCAPVMQMATPRTVVISNVDVMNATQAHRMAEEECVKHGRHAVEIPDNIRDGRQSYECKD